MMQTQREQGRSSSRWRVLVGLLFAMLLVVVFVMPWLQELRRSIALSTHIRLMTLHSEVVLENPFAQEWGAAKWQALQESPAYTAIGGVDTNYNAVRDDVEQQLLQIDEDSLTLAAFLQYAQALNVYTLKVFDERTANSAGDKLARAEQCLQERAHAKAGGDVARQQALYTIFIDTITTAQWSNDPTGQRELYTQKAQQLATRAPKLSDNPCFITQDDLLTNN